MAARLHHVVCFSYDPDHLVGFLTDVVGMVVVETFEVPGDVLAASLGWPANEGARAQMLGEGSSGLIEVLEVPMSLRDRVPAGIAMLSFGVRDLSRAMETATHWGSAVTDVTSFATDATQLDVVMCAVEDGIPVEFVRFAPRTGGARSGD